MKNYKNNYMKIKYKYIIIKLFSIQFNKNNRIISYLVLYYLLVNKIKLNIL